MKLCPLTEDREDRRVRKVRKRLNIIQSLDSKTRSMSVLVGDTKKDFTYIIVVVLTTNFTVVTSFGLKAVLNRVVRFLFLL